MSVSVKNALLTFLCQHFTAAELIGLARDVLGSDSMLRHSLPSVAAPVSEMAVAFVDLIRRHGLLDREFFDALRDARPRLSEQIQQIEAETRSTGRETDGRARNLLSIRLEIEPEDLSATDLEKLLTLMRSISGDARMTIEAIRKGSTIVLVRGEDDALRRLERALLVSRTLAGFVVSEVTPVKTPRALGTAMQSAASFERHPRAVSASLGVSSHRTDTKAIEATVGLSHGAVTRSLRASYRRPGRVSLRVTGGPVRGQVFSLNIDPLRPLRGGRGPFNDIVLADESVSAQHFELRAQGTTLLLRDLDSTNGIRLGPSVIREAWIDPPTRFKVGDSELELVGVEVVEAALRPELEFAGMIGRSAVMRELFVRIDHIAGNDHVLARVPTLLTGLPGTGKQRAARAIHTRSARRDCPFIVIDGRAATVTSLDEALAGAQTGTLLIDDIDRLPLDLQPRFLAHLDRSGGDVCIIATTHHDLVRSIVEGRFREDLFFRFGVRLELPALRDRGDDVLLLAEFFLDRLSAGGARRRLSDEARASLRGEPWPGNVRQLRRVIERAARVANGPEIGRGDLALEAYDDSGQDLQLEWLLGMPIREAADEFQRAYYQHLLTRFRTRGEAARFAGVTPEGLRQALLRLKAAGDDEPTG